MNDLVTDYTVVAEGGIYLTEGGELYPKGSVVSLDNELAGAFLAEGLVEAVVTEAPKQETTLDESASEAEGNIDPKTGSAVGTVDTSSLPQVDQAELEA